MHLTKNTQERCVMARVMRQKKLHQRNFSLKEHGTWEEATRAAKRWIDDILPELPPKIRSKGLMTRRNHSGVVGVHWSPGIVKKPNGNVYECPRWIASWVGCPYNGGVGWMEKEFEHEAAFVLAVLSRRLETVNRDKILTNFETILGTKEYRQIASLMQM
jgi:hypothetical protein